MLLSSVALAAATLPPPKGVDLTNWYIAYYVAAAILAVVVALVAIILELARRINKQALDITQALDDSRQNTLPLWDVAGANRGLQAIVKNAQTARVGLGG